MEFVLPVSLHELETVKLRFTDLIGNHLSASEELVSALENKINSPASLPSLPI